MKITVAGAGTWGTALGRVLALNGHNVCIWSRFQEETDARFPVPEDIRICPAR